MWNADGNRCCPHNTDADSGNAYTGLGTIGDRSDEPGRSGEQIPGVGRGRASLRQGFTCGGVTAGARQLRCWDQAGSASHNPTSSSYGADAAFARKGHWGKQSCKLSEPAGTGSHRGERRAVTAEGPELSAIVRMKLATPGLARLYPLVCPGSDAAEQIGKKLMRNPAVTSVRREW